MIMGVLNECMERDIKVWSIKDNMRLGNDLSCKVLAFALEKPHSGQNERSIGKE